MQYAFRHGFSIDGSCIIDTGKKASDSIDAFEVFFESYLLKNKFDLDALFCANDESACTAISKLVEHGFKVPQDVAVVGFNNSSISRLFSPKIATVDRCHDQLGIMLEKMLFARLDNSYLPVQINRVDMHFLPRASAEI
jgi:DNA-binding LacI/PurR family transcriptional regulator